MCGPRSNSQHGTIAAARSEITPPLLAQEAVMSYRLLLTLVAASGLAFSPGAWPQNIKFAILGPMAYAYGEDH
jgi:hypothetical protein